MYSTHTLRGKIFKRNSLIAIIYASLDVNCQIEYNGKAQFATGCGCINRLLWIVLFACQFPKRNCGFRTRQLRDLKRWTRPRTMLGARARGQQWQQHSPDRRRSSCSRRRTRTAGRRSPARRRRCRTCRSRGQSTAPRSRCSPGEEEEVQIVTQPSSHLFVHAAE